MWSGAKGSKVVVGPLQDIFYSDNKIFMSLTHSKLGGTKMKDAIGIARDGDNVIYFIEDQIDLLKELDAEDAERVVMRLVDQVIEEMGFSNLSMKDLMNIDNDIMIRSTPTNRYHKMVSGKVRDRVGARESKFMTARDKFRVVPRGINEQRESLYIFGQSGSGKTTFAQMYIMEYKRIYPNNRVFVFSRKEYDSILDDNIPDLIRIPLNREFVRNVTRPNAGTDILEQYRDALILFDDFLRIDDKVIKKAVEHLKNSVLELGRQYNIDSISIQHRGLGYKNSECELTECTGIVFFPRSNLMESKKLIESKLYYDKEQMSRIFDKDTFMKERWVCIYKPNIVISENYIKVLDI
jgi:hypothetical protein